MNIATTKLELTKQLLNTTDEGIINHIKAVFETRTEDWWDTLPDEIKASVERGLKQSERGETKSQAEVMKKYKKWLKK